MSYRLFRGLNLTKSLRIRTKVVCSRPNILNKLLITPIQNSFPLIRRRFISTNSLVDALVKNISKDPLSLINTAKSLTNNPIDPKEKKDSNNSMGSKVTDDDLTKLPKIDPLEGEWVSDGSSLLSKDHKVLLNEKLSSLNALTKIQPVILVIENYKNIPSIHDNVSVDCRAFSQRVLTYMRVGSADYQDGLVLAWFREQRQVHLVCGLGLDKLLTEQYTKQLINTIIIPEFRDQKFGSGLIFGTSALSKYLVNNYKRPNKSFTREEVKLALPEGYVLPEETKAGINKNPLSYIKHVFTTKDHKLKKLLLAYILYVIAKKLLIFLFVAYLCWKVYGYLKKIYFGERIETFAYGTSLPPVSQNQVTENNNRSKDLYSQDSMNLEKPQPRVVYQQTPQNPNVIYQQSPQTHVVYVPTPVYTPQPAPPVQQAPPEKNKWNKFATGVAVGTIGSDYHDWHPPSSGTSPRMGADASFPPIDHGSHFGGGSVSSKGGGGSGY